MDGMGEAACKHVRGCTPVVTYTGVTEKDVRVDERRGRAG